MCKEKNPEIAKRWQIYPVQKDLSARIGQALHRHPAIGQILLNRRLSNLSSVREFLQPQPFTENFPSIDLQAATALIEACRQQKGKVLIYGDYDVDGITSTTLLVALLRQLQIFTDYHIPHRFSEGYGLNMAYAQQLAGSKYDLLIAVDCGISNLAEITYLKQHSKIKVLILDHHNLPAQLPPADAILNPKTLPLAHPLSGLCAAGLVYKFLEYYNEQYSLNLPITDYLDLVAIATIADIVPLLGANRLLVKAGLPKIKHSRHPGLRQLLLVAGFKGNAISPRDVGFMIAPRLNAAGRLKHAKLSVELLLAPDDTQAGMLAHQLQKLNEQRQLLEADITKNAHTQLENLAPELQGNLILLAGQDWHSGIIGITASRLVDKYGKPTIMIAHDEKTGRGSARSSGNFNIYELLLRCNDLFLNFGGHRQAAGFSILTENIPQLAERLLQIAASEIEDSHIQPLLDIDCILAPCDLQKELCVQIQELAPFGCSNPAPVFYTQELHPIDFRTVGNGKHLKATLTDTTGRIVVEAIGFNLSHKLPLLYNPQLELAFNLEINAWQGQELPQLQLLDIK